MNFNVIISKLMVRQYLFCVIVLNSLKYIRFNKNKSRGIYIVIVLMFLLYYEKLILNFIIIRI